MYTFLITALLSSMTQTKHKTERKISKMSITENIMRIFKSEFTLKMAYDANPDKNKESVRARIYENLGIHFEKIGRGLYKTIGTKDTCNDDILLIEGDGRQLDMLADESVDAIITDHPWYDEKANKGGNRGFATYNCFNYEQSDFDEKARLLKPGCFLVEIIPAENATNYEYLYKLKKMAKQAGFEYYSKVIWKKGTFVSNTGRKAKNTEDVMIFSKGKPRSLRIDAKKTKQTGIVSYMKGTSKMLPTCFDTSESDIQIPEYIDVQPVPKKDVIAQSEKPVDLVKQIIEYITLENEIILDQFAGSGVTGLAARMTNRLAILVEIEKEKCQKIAQRLNLTPATISIAEAI